MASSFLLLLSSLLFLVGADCNNSLVDCSGHGNCVISNGTFECECDRNYITWPMTNYKSCNYKQQTWKDPFIAQLLFGYASGIGPFLLGNNNWGVLELLVTWLGWIPAVCVLQLCKGEGSSIFFGSWIFAIVALWLIFLGLIAGRILPDGEGAPLGHWD